MPRKYIGIQKRGNKGFLRIAEQLRQIGRVKVGNSLPKPQIHNLNRFDGNDFKAEPVTAEEGTQATALDVVVAKARGSPATHPFY